MIYKWLTNDLWVKLCTNYAAVAPFDLQAGLHHEKKIPNLQSDAVLW